MAYNPNNPNGQATSANSAPVVIASDQTSVSVSGTVTVSSSALATGAATAANQATEISSLATIASNTTNAGTPVVSGTVTANAGTNLNTSALALESGGNLASLNTKVTTTVNGIKVDGSAVTQPISVSSLPLPTGAATSALQSSIITTLGTPFQAGGSIGNTSFGATQSGTWNINNISGTVSLPTGAATAANQTSEIGYLTTIATNTGAQATDFQTTGTITALNGTVSGTGQGVYTDTFSITGTWSASLVIEGQTPDLNWTQLPINIVSSQLPYYQTQTITSNGTYLVTGGGFLNIRIRASAFTSGTVNVAIDGSLSQQTVIANINTPDLYLIGAASQTATVNNILGSTSGSTSTSALGFKSASIQVVSTGTAGTFIFEGSNDNVNFNTITVYNSTVLTGTPITAAITASASQNIYLFPINHAYIRLRIATTITGGSIQAFSKLSQVTFSPPVYQVAQATSGNLNVAIGSGTVTTVSSVTASNSAIPGQVSDVASAAITTTTTTAAFTPTYGCSYQINIPVTAVSGTSPTLDIEIQESRDGGTNWIAVYDFPRITVSGSYNSPLMPFTGNKVRYAQTVGGTSPSFTRAINRLQSSTSSPTFFRQIVDRTISLTTLNSTTVSLNSEQQNKNVQVVANIGAATTTPILQIQASDDSGVTWYNIGSTLTTAANSTTQLTVNNMTAQLYRVLVSSAGVGVTPGYVLLRAF